MKREVERKQKLPAFSITVSQLGVLITRLVALFAGNTEVHVSIRVTLKKESLRFDSVEELKSYRDLPGRVVDFTVSVSQFGTGRRVWMYSGSALFDSRSMVAAEADTEAWCAGAIETVQSFIQVHKLWYHWFVAAPIGWILLVSSYLPTAILQLMPKGTVVDKAISFAWFGVVLTMFVLWVGKGWLLPSSVLKISEEDGFVRRYIPELSLIIALASAVLTVVGWFVGKS